MLAERAVQFASENQGFEVVYSLVEFVQKQIETLRVELPVARATPSEDVQRGRLLILLIDHMNDSRGYTKKLAHWDKQLGLVGMQLFRHCPSSSHMHRFEGVLLLLYGARGEDVSEWLCRLRTHKVDLNARGTACKERKSTVLAQLDAESPPLCLLRDSPQQQHYMTMQYETTEEALDFFRRPEHGLPPAAHELASSALQKRM